MGRYSKNVEVERQVTERSVVVRSDSDRRAAVLGYLERLVWPNVVPEALGKAVSRQEDELFGL